MKTKYALTTGLSSAISAILASGLPLSVAAQQQNDSILEEVIVTAQRREEKLQDVPITITHLDSEQLEAANIQELSEIAELTPALRFDTQGPFTQPTIRGVGTSIVTSGSGANVGIYVDGFYVPNPIAADFQLFNIENIQILKGPQGTLFGRNTTGGAILVNTEAPSTETSGILSASYGSYEAREFEGYFTTGLSDRIAVDISGVYSKGDGYIENIATGKDDEAAYENWSVRGGVKAEISDRLTAIFRYEHQEIDDPLVQEQAAYVLNGQPLTLAAVVPGAIVATEFGEVSHTGHVGFTADNDVYQLTLTLDLPLMTLTSYSQYREESSVFDQNAAPGSGHLVYINVPVDDEIFTQEFLLSSTGDGRLQWTAGAFYFDYEDTFDANISLGGAPFMDIAGSFSDTVSKAVFVDATYQLSENFYLTGGLRYSDDAVEDAYYVLADGTRVFGPTLDGDRVTPRVVLRYTPTDNSSVYASYTRGYKAAIYNLGGQSLAPIDPETIEAYEIGYKYASTRLSFDMSVYHYQYEDLQVASYGLTAENVPVSQITNAADSRINGIEGQLQYEVLNGFKINLSAAYLDAEYQDFANAPGFEPCFSFPECGAAFGTSLPAIIDASGFSMQRAPEFTASLGASYNMDFAEGTLVLSGNLYYTSKFYFDTSEQLAQESYATLGLRAAWTDPSERYTFAVYGENLTDDEHFLQAFPQTTSWPVVWDAPATVTAEAKVRF